jgi:SsrA-binding protein|tara:strand:- start:277 stop:738 length:462 start_codon:yes stop_codon:yes gene_type:complete
VDSVILKNSKARRDYEILETMEAGLVLRGTEVKSLRAGKGQLREAYAQVDRDGQAWLHNCHIDEYSHGNVHNHNPLDPRKLLLHRKQIDQLQGIVQQKGHSIIPLKFYWKKGRVKVLLGVGRGKGKFDKREAIRKRDADRELRRATMHAMKGK